MKWFSKILMKPGAKLTCPICQNKYPFGPVFDQYKRVCPICQSTLYEWHLDNKIVLIAPKNAPSELFTFIDYLKTLSEIDALKTLNLLDQILGE